MNGADLRFCSPQLDLDTSLYYKPRIRNNASRLFTAQLSLVLTGLPTEDGQAKLTWVAGNTQRWLIRIENQELNHRGMGQLPLEFVLTNTIIFRYL